MEFRVLNEYFVAQDILDSVDSIIWTERFIGYGDFEIYVNFSFEMLDLLKQGWYIKNTDSTRTMIIEDVRIKTNPETGNKLVVSGRSLESILDRRIILRQIQIDGGFQSGIQSILNEDVINSIYPERNFPNFYFVSSSDALITNLTLKAQYYSQNLYDAIKDLCTQAGIGFKVLLDSSNHFYFNLYAGVDRSYSQITNPYVIFSPDFDNLIKSEYYTTQRYKKNFVLVSGDPTGVNGLPLRAQVWTTDVGTGLSRREMFIDARDLPRYTESTGVQIDDTTYLNQLTQRGKEELSNNTDLTIFDGEIDLSRSYKYRTDFFLGDIIQMKDQYGHSARAQILEMTFSQDLNGSRTYPTLKTI